MTVHHMKNAALSAVAVTALAWAGSAQAASDYLLKFEGVPGETNAADGVGGGAMPHVKGDARHKGWIELDSVQLGTARTATGETIAADHEVKSPRDAASGQATGKRMHNPVRISSNREASAPSVSEITVSKADEQTAALLLPAVQKIREATARMAPWAGCAAGQKFDVITIKQKSTGKEGSILDPVVTSCATDSVSFNFTKIEWK
jgi:hypothetical protein